MSFSNPPPNLETPVAPDDERKVLQILVGPCDIEGAFVSYVEQVRHAVTDHQVPQVRAEIAALAAMAMVVADMCDNGFDGLDTFREITDQAWKSRAAVRKQLRKNPILDGLLRNNPLTPSG